MTRIAAIVRAGLLASGLLIFASPAIAAECAPYPAASWWGSISHEKVVDYVHSRHDGVWAPYLKKWERRLDTAVHALDRGVPIIFKQSGVELSGDSLAFYVLQLRKRIDVSRCLAAAHPATDHQLTAQIID